MQLFTYHGISSLGPSSSLLVHLCTRMFPMYLCTGGGGGFGGTGSSATSPPCSGGTGGTGSAIMTTTNARYGFGTYLPTYLHTTYIPIYLAPWLLTTQRLGVLSSKHQPDYPLSPFCFLFSIYKAGEAEPEMMVAGGLLDLLEMEEMQPIQLQAKAGPIVSTVSQLRLLDQVVSK